MLLFTLMQVIHTRLTGVPVSEPIAETIESTRAGIVPIFGSSLKHLKEHRADQQRFAHCANELASLAQELINQEQESNRSPTPTLKKISRSSRSLPLSLMATFKMKRSIPTLRVLVRCLNCRAPTWRSLIRI